MRNLFFFFLIFTGATSLWVDFFRQKVSDENRETKGKGKRNHNSKASSKAVRFTLEPGGHVHGKARCTIPVSYFGDCFAVPKLFVSFFLSFAIIMEVVF